MLAMCSHLALCGSGQGWLCVPAGPGLLQGRLVIGGLTCCREDLVIATKVAGPSGQMQWIRGGPHSLDARNITEAIDGSLHRLQTDYIDLVQLHWPDRSGCLPDHCLLLRLAQVLPPSQVQAWVQQGGEGKYSDPERHPAVTGGGLSAAGGGASTLTLRGPQRSQVRGAAA